MLVEDCVDGAPLPSVLLSLSFPDSVPVVSADNLNEPELQLVVKVPKKPFTRCLTRMLFGAEIECAFVSMRRWISVVCLWRPLGSSPVSMWVLFIGGVPFWYDNQYLIQQAKGKQSISVCYCAFIKLPLTSSQTQTTKTTQTDPATQVQSLTFENVPPVYKHIFQKWIYYKC